MGDNQAARVEVHKVIVCISFYLKQLKVRGAFFFLSSF